MRRTTILLVAFSLIGARGLTAQEHDHELSAEGIGSVHFLTSCRKVAQPGFNRAVALLHSFQYEQARQAFNEVAALDPFCAMAQWGIAMSHYHGLWHNGDTAAGHKAWQRAREIARTNPKTTARENAYIDALGEIYREDGKDDYPARATTRRNLLEPLLPPPNQILKIGAPRRKLWVLQGA